MKWQTSSITDTLKIEFCRSSSSHFDPFKHNAGNWVDDRFLYWASLFRTFFSYYIMHISDGFCQTKIGVRLFFIFFEQTFSTQPQNEEVPFLCEIRTFQKCIVIEKLNHFSSRSPSHLFKWVLDCVLFSFWFLLNNSKIQLVYAEHVDLTNNSCDGWKNRPGKYLINWNEAIVWYQASLLLANVLTTNRNRLNFWANIRYLHISI